DDGEWFGPVLIQNVYTLKYANALPPGILPNPDLTLTTSDSEDSQKWYFTNINGNFCRIKNKKTGLYVGVDGAFHNGAYANEVDQGRSLEFVARPLESGWWIFTPTQLGPERESLWWTANDNANKIQYIVRIDQKTQYWLVTNTTA
ncbi:hypothetical protein PHLGIDRAFT_121668, partial [Phlebiopsis gigantea 11061_1 CR5-6]